MLRLTEIKIGQLLLGITLVWSITTGSVYAQEKDPLMFSVEMGFTLGGTVAGAGIGALVWLTDPLGPTSIKESVEVGVLIGTFLGAALGFYVLKQALVEPPEEQINELLENLLSQELYESEIVSFKSDPYSRRNQQPRVTLTLLNYRF